MKRMVYLLVLSFATSTSIFAETGQWSFFGGMN